MYCYIVETGEYEDRESHILGHEIHYSHEEFDDICKEITKKYGKMENVKSFDISDLTDVESIKYTIDGYELIDYLVNEYGFVELNIPRNDGYNVEEISRTPVPRENLRRVEIKQPPCPVEPKLNLEPKINSNLELKFEENLMTCVHCDSDFDRVKHFHARCKPVLKIKKMKD